MMMSRKEYKLEAKLDEVRQFATTFEAVPDGDAMSTDYSYDLGFAEGHNAALKALQEVLDK